MPLQTMPLYLERALGIARHRRRRLAALVAALFLFQDSPLVQQEEQLMSWIIFEHAGPSKSGKTHEWRVQPKDNGDLAACIGVVKWYAGWRGYAFMPYGNTVFEEDCLREIADFCERQTREHKQRASA